MKLINAGIITLLTTFTFTSGSIAAGLAYGFEKGTNAAQLSQQVGHITRFNAAGANAPAALAKVHSAPIASQTPAFSQAMSTANVAGAVSTSQPETPPAQPKPALTDVVASPHPVVNVSTRKNSVFSVANNRGDRHEQADHSHSEGHANRGADNAHSHATGGHGFGHDNSRSEGFGGHSHFH